MRVTRGDNWAFFFLPGLTFLALTGTFIAGKMYEIVNPEKEIIIYLKVKNKKPSVFCDHNEKKISKSKENIWKLSTKDCFGTVSVKLDGQLSGICEKSIDDFARIEIILGKEISCKYFE